MNKLDEKFINKNIAELCREYDSIRGANVNLARITPDFIDGLKPVARRLLYVMFLKDHGKNFRKVAAITGDTIARLHHHSQSSVKDCLDGLAQWWKNNIPLIEGYGNFGCHDKETEVLTLEGWKYFKDITKEDKLASVSPFDGNLIFENPINITKEKYKGRLIVGKHDSLDFALTPNHRMLVRKFIKGSGLSKDYSFINVSELGHYSGLMTKFYQNKERSGDITLKVEITDNGNVLPEINIPMDDWLQFLGVYLADGCMYIGENEGDYIINLSGIKSRKRKYYKEILQNIGVDVQYTGRGYRFYNKRIWKLLESYGLFGKKAPDKFIPDFVFGLDHSHIEKFLYGFAIGDGQFMPLGNVSYFTSSEKMANQLQILLLMCGKYNKKYKRSPRHSVIEGREVQQIRDQYQVYEWGGKKLSIDRKIHISEMEYDDYVYCAEVPTYNTLITKRNECILLSGNSVAGDEAGADRYIQARLSKYAYDCFFSDWEESAVDMIMGADEETPEPLYLPAKYPNILLNGSLGIGYGMASNLFPANFKETVEACIALMANPDAEIVIIPDSPTGCDIIATDFKKMCDNGNAGYSMRCKYEIDSEQNQITITNLPYQVTANNIREKIADIKERGGLPELIAMNDFSGKVIDLRLSLRDDVNPYKFMKKLIEQVGGLEKSYPVNIVVTNDYQSFDWSVKKLLVEWIRYRREQKRVIVNHKRTSLLAEQRTNDVKIFLMNGDNLENTINIFKNSRNRADIERNLIEKYRNTEIRMDSLQARALSDLKMYKLCKDEYESCLKRAEEIIVELKDIEDILSANNGIDKLIIAELRDGIKKFGTPRKSNVVPYKISVDTEVQGTCILQLSSDGMIIRKLATNVDEEPVPADSNGFAVKVDNDASFILIDDKGYYSFIRVRELPVDQEVPVNRFIKQALGNIVAMLPFDFESDKCCTLISKLGMIKRMRIADITPSKRPCIDISKEDNLVKGIVTKIKSPKDILVYTSEGMGQRLDPNLIKITSTLAKGVSGFKLRKEDEIVGCYAIDPTNQYLLYVTSKGKARLNAISYLPMRDSKHDTMVRLISLNDRDHLVGIVGCNKLDKVQVFYQDGETEIIDVSKISEETMSSEPKKVTSRNAVSNNIVKVKLL